MFIFICFVVHVTAQTDSLSTDDIAIGKVTYLHIEHSEFQKYKNGKATLLFNPVKSLYILEEAPKADFMSNIGDTPRYIIGDPEGFPVYKLHAEKKILFKKSSFVAGGLCVIEDTLGAINWTIQPDKRQFGFIVCQKATGYFRGREYEAWFTFDIPISSGPFKLGGLPGLILEARSLDGEVEFIFQSLEMPINSLNVIHPPKGKYMGMNYAALKKAEKENIRRREKESLASGVTLTLTLASDGIEKE